MNAYAWMALAVVAWALEYPLMKQGTRVAGVMATGAVMFMLSAVLLGATLAVRGRTVVERAPWKWLVLIGLLGIFINALGLWAIRLTSVANAATLSRTDVLFSLLIAFLFAGERTGRGIVLSILVMLVGVSSMTGMLCGKSEAANAGDLLVLASALGVAVNAFVIKRALRTADSLLVGAVNSGMNGLFFLVAALATHRHATGAAEALRMAWPGLLALGILSYMFFLGYYQALRTIPVWEALLMFLAVPAIAALFSRVWQGETLVARQWAGMALISAGAAGIIFLRRRIQSVKSEETVA